ncbi:hypothetical protein MO973_00605 [Paenibacillus sp. TRM 82003]|nr:hypothetical protein [Paenibacillus sp. TRM 82003]
MSDMRETPKQQPESNKEQDDAINAQEMNESGIDYIWGSDQDELYEKQPPEAKK